MANATPATLPAAFGAMGGDATDEDDAAQRALATWPPPGHGMMNLYDHWWATRAAACSRMWVIHAPCLL